MNTKVKASLASVLTAIICIAGLSTWPSHHALAGQARAVEQYKIIYLNNTGEDAEASLNKAAAEGWEFKAALGGDAVLFSK